MVEDPTCKASQRRRRNERVRDGWDRKRKYRRQTFRHCRGWLASTLPSFQSSSCITSTPASSLPPSLSPDDLLSPKKLRVLCTMGFTENGFYSLSLSQETWGWLSRLSTVVLAPVAGPLDTFEFWVSMGLLGLFVFWCHQHKLNRIVKKFLHFPFLLIHSQYGISFGNGFDWYTTLARIKSISIF